MSFRLANLFPRVTAHSRARLVRLVAVGRRDLARAAGHAFLRRRVLHGRRAGQLPPAGTGLLCRTTGPRRGFRLDARRLLGFLPHRRGPGRHVPSPAPLPVSFSALACRPRLGIPVQLSADARGDVLLSAPPAAAAGCGHGGQFGLHLFQFQSLALRPSQRGGGRGPHPLAAGDDRHRDDRCEALESGPGPGLPGPLDRIADAAGLPAIRLVLALGRNEFHALAGRDAAAFSPRRLRNDVHLPRLHRLPAELGAARGHGQGNRPLGRGGAIAAHTGNPFPEHAPTVATCPQAQSSTPST